MKMKLDMPVDEFTTPNPVTARADCSVNDLKSLMKYHEVRHLPIVDEGEVVGIVSDRDLKMVSALNFSEKNLVKASDIMTSDLITFHCATPLEQVALEMSDKKIGSVLIRDEKNELLGIFTVTDALNALINILRGEK